jgi:nitrous oxide reductase accessory protein NosL
VRKSLSPFPFLFAALLSACATTGDSAPPVPAGAEASTRTEANGDVVTEYRVGGALAMVKVQPANGPTWYLVDSDGDGRLDRTSGEARDAPVYFKLYSW